MTFNNHARRTRSTSATLFRDYPCPYYTGWVASGNRPRWQIAQHGGTRLDYCAFSNANSRTNENVCGDPRVRAYVYGCSHEWHRKMPIVFGSRTQKCILTDSGTLANCNLVNAVTVHVRPKTATPTHV